MRSLEKTVKEVMTRRYSLELVDNGNYEYYIRFCEGNNEVNTKPVSDLKLALSIFDDMLVIAEGN